jgi:hypothetical protein
MLPLSRHLRFISGYKNCVILPLQFAYDVPQKIQVIHIVRGARVVLPLLQFLTSCGRRICFPCNIAPDERDTFGHYVNHSFSSSPITTDAISILFRRDLTICSSTLPPVFLEIQLLLKALWSGPNTRPYGRLLFDLIFGTLVCFLSQFHLHVNKI